MQKITTFLMFEGQAEAAVNLYTSLFPDSEIIHINRYDADGMGAEGTTQHVIFSLNGQTFMALDSHVHHDFSFTPAISLYVTCADEAEIDRIYAALVEGGEIMMPLDAYPFSAKFAWISDKFGVSWQLSLPQS